MDDTDNTEPDTLTSKQVADFLGVSIYSLRGYRQRPADDPMHLPATRDPDHPNVVHYSRTEVFEFVARNAHIRERILAAFAPPGIVEAFTPAPTPARTPAGLYSLANHFEESTP